MAHIGGITIGRDELDRVLYRSYGINLLADLVELDLATHALAQKGLTVDDADVAAERQRSLGKMFAEAKPEDYDRLFTQLKAEKHLTDAEFDLGFRTTATLRKLAHPQVRGQVSDASVRQAFGILYGENRVIADIAVQNLLGVAQVQRRVAAGEPFGAVARAMSTDVRTRDNNGEWPPFSINTPGVPPALLKEAFALKVDQVSPEPIVEASRYHVIKLLAVLPPKIVKYDDVKADVRKQVEDQLEQTFINQLRDQLRQATLAGLQIDDPTLKQSWDAMIAAQQPKGATIPPAEAVGKIHRAEGPPAPATRP